MIREGEPFTAQDVLDDVLWINEHRKSGAPSRYPARYVNGEGASERLDEFVRPMIDYGPLADGSMIRAGDALRIERDPEGKPVFGGAVPCEEFDGRFQPVDEQGQRFALDGPEKRTVLFERDAESNLKHYTHAWNEMARDAGLCQRAALAWMQATLVAGRDFDGTAAAEAIAAELQPHLPGVTGQYNVIQSALAKAFPTALANAATAERFAMRAPDKQAAFVSAWAAFAAEATIGPRRIDPASLDNMAKVLTTPTTPRGSRALPPNDDLVEPLKSAIGEQQKALGEKANGSRRVMDDGTQFDYNQAGKLEGVKNLATGLFKIAAEGARALGDMVKAAFSLVFARVRAPGGRP